MDIKLHQLNKPLKNLFTAYLFVLTIGLMVGLIFLASTTDASPSGAVERWNGSAVNPQDEFSIQENYPKPVSEMLITTHNHLFGFAFIFISIGLIFYFNQTIKGFWKMFLLIEPFVSTIVTFGSIWLVRFVHESFIYLTMLSAILIYGSYFVMFAVVIYELNFKRG